MITTDSDVLTAITGGIGSGKSVVAKIVSALGYEVYDCDSRARVLMESDGIKELLADRFGSHIFNSDRQLQRKVLADIVFSDPEKLQQLNSITHSAVREDLAGWVASHSQSSPLFVETAILYQSGIDRMVSSVWEVTAPRELRIARVMQRNGLSRDEIIARIEAQDSYIPPLPHKTVFEIVNDGVRPLLPRVECLIDKRKRS